MSPNIIKYSSSTHGNSSIPQVNSVAEILVNNVKKGIQNESYIKFSNNDIFFNQNTTQSRSPNSHELKKDLKRPLAENKDSKFDQPNNEKEPRLSGRSNITRSSASLKKDAQNLSKLDKQPKKQKKVKTDKPASSSEPSIETVQLDTNGLFTGRSNDYCDACEQTGRFICCDACPRVFHFLCAEPPLDEKKAMELDHWFCRECDSARNKYSTKSESSDSSIMEPLIEKLINSNPRTFSIPLEIKSEFSGIKSGVAGEYGEQKKRSYKNTGNLERDFKQLVDENGELVFCYRCEKTALHGNVIKCDFCDLYWHWDCLTPPPSSLPLPSQKWICPNHGDESKVQYFVYS
ncbi:hypothetical protein AYI70_g5785 [Smittium culicis]|uniref:PHD-type domain-containing protein n=1 Tax=Smittium culicis TaxID=133412 RepID=A0A1R1XSY1_9FUNG|nr:hypothetical protein AYI70_g5785 [Smittium culicis]